MKDDCIAAIATPLGTGGIGIVRLSGKAALATVQKIFSSDLADIKSHSVRYGKIKFNNELIDECLLIYMASPKSYTKEDVVEINCHGGVRVTQKVLEALLSSGARLAEPGEFTKRAFLNGRIDLSQAEAVIDLINSKTDYALKSALSQLSGSVSKEVGEIRSELLRVLAAIAAAIDYPEHDEEEITNQLIMDTVLNLENRIKVLIENFDTGKIMREGLRTVIIGKPNVGKSSVLNMLLREERAIVTDIAGTTRDLLHEYMNMAGITLKISDTAGLRETDDIVEKIGVDKTREYITQADLVFVVLDGSRPLTYEDEQALETAKDKERVVILNKSDLPPGADREQIRLYIEQERIIPFSAKERFGLDELSALVKSLFFKGEIKYEQTLTNARHKECLNLALENLSSVKDSIANFMTCEFISPDLQEAYENMGKIVGDTLEEDLIDRIFSDFCLGK